MELFECLRKTKADLPPCSPPFWARTGHQQTMLGHLLPSPGLEGIGEELHISLEREEERMHSIFISGTSDTVVYLFHGLGGSTEASYMQRTALRMKSLGHHVFLNNHRGCGKGMGLAAEPYHSGRADDLSRIIAFGRKKFPDHRHVAIGFSLSGNALLLLAAKVRAVVQPDFAIAVNAPINLDRASIKLQKGPNKIYDKRFVLELENYIRFNRPLDSKKLPRARDLREFDELFTAPISGFRDRKDYYDTCSAKQYLRNISIPTVIITAKNDPIVSIEDYLEAKFSQQCFVHIEENGGHMGYLMRKGLGFERWLDHALEKYVRAITASSSSAR